ncbi:unnamed protein product [Adineta steineri]|uniref:CSD domain-containing protein n=1 Tax=Adineta steineri TaxID=433720 RepID=A0A814UUL0_9BILA|nr:unnamed protein product [Adineta steineri]CAF3714576.1 unnamed protein product [Adineta steineri]
MLTRLPIRRFSINNKKSRLYRWLDIYEDFVGLKEVKQAQSAVNDAERSFIKTQTERRSYSNELIKLQNDLARIRIDMDKLSRSDDAYFELFKSEHDLVKKEKLTQLELKKQDEIERQLFSSLQLALRESQEKEKMRIERTKYWSIIGSVVGALAGMIGATLTNRHRIKEFHNITQESQKLYENLIDKQEISIDKLKQELTNLSSNDSYENILLLNQQIEERIQSKLIYHTNFMLISAIIRQDKVFRLQIQALSSIVNNVNSNRDLGIVKRFSKDKGFGFITRKNDGTDFFVHFQSIVGTGFKTLEEGQEVEFKGSEGLKGREARDKQVKDSKPVTKDRYTGTIRKFVKNRGFGFITRKSDGADFFVHSRSIHHRDLENFHEGIEVDFYESESNRGAEAKDVRLIKNTNTKDQMVNDEISDTNKQETGIIHRWNKERGFGFVRRIANGNDLFVHARSLKDGLRELEIGQEIQFRIQTTEKGDEAYDVHLIKNK